MDRWLVGWPVGHSDGARFHAGLVRGAATITPYFGKNDWRWFIFSSSSPRSALLAHVSTVWSMSKGLLPFSIGTLELCCSSNLRWRIFTSCRIHDLHGQREPRLLAAHNSEVLCLNYLPTKSSSKDCYLCFVSHYPKSDWKEHLFSWLLNSSNDFFLFYI